MAIAAVEQGMCDAVAAVTLLRGRNPRKCSASASALVEFDGAFHEVCKIHLKSWNEGDRQMLAARWGWTSRRGLVPSDAPLDATPTEWIPELPDGF